MKDSMNHQQLRDLEEDWRVRVRASFNDPMLSAYLDVVGGPASSEQTPDKLPTWADDGFEPELRAMLAAHERGGPFHLHDYELNPAPAAPVPPASLDKRVVLLFALGRSGDGEVELFVVRDAVGWDIVAVHLFEETASSEGDLSGFIGGLLAITDPRDVNGIAELKQALEALKAHSLSCLEQLDAAMGELEQRLPEEPVSRGGTVEEAWLQAADLAEQIRAYAMRIDAELTTVS